MLYTNYVIANMLQKKAKEASQNRVKNIASNQPINGMEVLKIPHSSPGTVHTFAFSMEANENLFIKENMSVKGQVFSQ